MTRPDLRPDCARCSGLCCVAFAFDRSPDFALAKPADTPCPNLCADDRCAIHAGLAGQGFAGCVTFDCLGAGQRVVPEMFPGRSWRTDPQLAGRIFAAFRLMRQVHELIGLLETAARLPLAPGEGRTRQALEAQLCPDGGWTEAGLATFAASGTAENVHRFLAGLRPPPDAAAVITRNGAGY